MPDDPGVKASRADLALAGVLALALTAGFHVAFARRGLNLADEGFLLYGVQRVLAGDVPLRDFQSYEPGRYIWCAAWCQWMGDGFLALRGALALFQALGLFCGLLVARRAVTDRRLLLPIGLVLLAWMFPRYRVFETGIAMMAVLAALLLIERPSTRRHLLAGVFVGLAACFGRNLGLYAAVGIGALVVVLALRERNVRRAGGWCLGIVLGYAPILLMVAFVPGFARSFVDSVFFYVKEGVNFPLPYPWPWQVGFANLSWIERTAIGCAFLLPVLACPLGVVLGLLTPKEQLGRRAACIAASFVGLAFLHQVAVRSDAFHLTACIHPALLAVLAAPRALGLDRKALPAWIATGFLIVVTVLAVPGLNPDVEYLRPGDKRRPPVACKVAGDELIVDRVTAAQVERIGEVFAEHVPAEERYVFMAPTYPALYPILGKLSPVWGLYFLWPASDASQERILADLEAKRVRFLFIVEAAVDNRRDLKFQSTHPRVWSYALERFERIPTPSLPTNYFLFRRR